VIRRQWLLVVLSGRQAGWRLAAVLTLRKAPVAEERPVAPSWIASPICPHQGICSRPVRFGTSSLYARRMMEVDGSVGPVLPLKADQRRAKRCGLRKKAGKRGTLANLARLRRGVSL
jgi:hypothetical protein